MYFGVFQQQYHGTDIVLAIIFHLRFQILIKEHGCNPYKASPPKKLGGGGKDKIWSPRVGSRRSPTTWLELTRLDLTWRLPLPAALTAELSQVGGSSRSSGRQPDSRQSSFLIQDRQTNLQTPMSEKQKWSKMSDGVEHWSDFLSYTRHMLDQVVRQLDSVNRIKNMVRS